MNDTLKELAAPFQIGHVASETQLLDLTKCRGGGFRIIASRACVTETEHA